MKTKNPEIVAVKTLTLSVRSEGPSYTEPPYHVSFYLSLLITEGELEARGSSAPVMVRLNAKDSLDVIEKTRQIVASTEERVYKLDDLNEALLLFPLIVVEEALRVAPFPKS